MTKYLFEVKTIKSGAFRTLIEALKEPLTDVNWEFTPKGISVLSMDNAHIVLVNLHLDAEQFEEYYCNKNYTVGINMSNFFKIIKSLTNSDTLTLFLEKNDETRLGIKIENGEKNSKIIFKMNTLDINIDKPHIPNEQFSSHITMPSVDFQKICRDMRVISDKVEIKCVGNQLSFKAVGDFAEQETIIIQNQIDNKGECAIIKSYDDTIFQGLYILEQLVSFTKCTNLCNTVQIFMKNDFPLVIRYKVSCLGEIKFCLVPINEDD